MPPLSPFARQTLRLIDLTELAFTAQAGDITSLCLKACDLPVPVAALCVRPQFVALAKAALLGQPIKVATVINFPTAEKDSDTIGLNIDAAAQAAETREAIANGADEIDVVFAWKAFLQGDHDGPRRCLEAVKEACGDKRLKVILESSAFEDLALLRIACDLAIDAGADFLKTSTGFHDKGGATLEAARVLFEASRAVARQIGVKISGGVRTPDQAESYINMAVQIMGLNWVQPDNFRIGASKLVDGLIAAPTPSTAGGY